MQVISPLPVRLVALTLALPGVFLAGRSLARSMEGDRRVAAVITPAVSASLWLVAIHLVGRATGSFSTGLIGGTLVVSAGGIAAAYVRHKSGADSARPRGPVIPVSAWVGAIVAMALLAPSAFAWAIHDETWPTGHMSIPAQMLNDVYPPRDANFPSLELHYHYGFDILTAVTIALTRLPVSHALDTLTVLAWGYAYLLLWTLGERVVGKSRGALTAIVTLFGGGASFLVSKGLPLSWGSFAEPYTIEGLWVNPSLTSYIFQHPWTLGLPLGLAAVLVVSDRRCRAAPRYAVLGVLFLLLSLSQLVLFLTLMGAFLAQEALAGGFVRSPGRGWMLRYARLDSGRLLAMVATFALVLAGARRLGGFFGDSYDGSGSGLIFHPGITETFAGSVGWLAVTYGLLLPLGVLGLFFVRRERVFFAALFGGCFAILWLVRHGLTWDIVKFATVAAVALGVLASAVLARLASAPRSFLSAALLVALTAGTITQGLGFSILMGFFPQRAPQLWDRSMPELGATDAQAVTWLRTHVSPPDIIYRRRPEAYRYSVWGGLPLAWIGPEAKMLGFSAQRLAPRKELLEDMPPDAGAYVSQHVRWFVLEASDRTLNRHARRWLEEGAAIERATFGRLRIIELLPGPSM